MTLHSGQRRALEQELRRTRCPYCRKLNIADLVEHGTKAMCRCGGTVAFTAEFLRVETKSGFQWSVELSDVRIGL